MKNIYFLLLFITNSVFSQTQYDFAVYHDGNVGAWEDGIVAFEQFLNWKGLSHNRVTATDINTVTLKNYYSAIYFPGGDADYYNADINYSGIQNIRELVAEGGAYIGICAGAEFACDKLVWQGIAYDYPLDLFQGEAIGPIDELAVWDDYDMVTLTMNPENEINFFEPANEDILYWGGCVYSPYAGTVFDTVATFDGYYDKPGIINFSYEQGRVLFISPHPEIEEDSDRDYTNVAQELDDNGSDWNFLWSATDWLLGNPVSQPADLPVLPATFTKAVTIYPNPAENILNIKTIDLQYIKHVIIYTQIGQIVFSETIKNNTIDLTKLPAGMYIIEIKVGEQIFREKLNVIR